ncbi:hypothetical protein DR093_00205 [Mycoplasma flocculare]|nr:hypothetical protein [Mesomycoplasma flocculare]
MYFGKNLSGFNTFKIETENSIFRENDQSFLGSKNENLNIYLLDRLDANKVEKTSPVRSYSVNYWNKKVRNIYYKLNYFGFKSVDYSDNRYKETFQRNIRFSSGTSILLDTNGNEALFLTNKHVLYNKKNQPMWHFFGYPFIIFYFNNKINFLPSPDYSRILDILYIKEDYEKREQKFEKKQNARTKQVFVKQVYEKYFRVVENFNSHKKDLGLFYFKYKDFISDFLAAGKFFEENRNIIKETFSWAKSTDIQTKMRNFEKSATLFSKYFEEMEKNGAVKLSDRLWKDGDIDYETKLGLFYPDKTAAKNMFKGVYIRKQDAIFFVTTGHGASGSGIFNDDGSLAFINYLIIQDPKQKGYYYDQNNLSNYIAAAIPLRTPFVDLTKEISKFYFNKS